MNIFAARWKVEAQNLVCHLDERRLVISEKQLEGAIRMYVSGHTKVIRESVKLVNETKVPSVFFSRWDTMVDRIKALQALEDIRPSLFTNSPTQQLRSIQAEKQTSIDRLIGKYWDVVSQKATAMKTEKAKASKYKVFSDTLSLYSSQMTQHNLSTFNQYKARIPCDID